MNISLFTNEFKDLKKLGSAKKGSSKERQSVDKTSQGYSTSKYNKPDIGTIIKINEQKPSADRKPNHYNMGNEFKSRNIKVMKTSTSKKVILVD